MGFLKLFPLDRGHGGCHVSAEAPYRIPSGTWIGDSAGKRDKQGRATVDPALFELKISRYNSRLRRRLRYGLADRSSSSR